jgi:hypothetical protein
VTCDYSGYMDDLKSRVQKTRENFSATVEQYERLKEKMITGKQVNVVKERACTAEDRYINGCCQA